MSNTFNIGDKVKLIDPQQARGAYGVVRYIACQGATQAGGRTCDRKACPHANEDKIVVWVKWQDATVCSYNYAELEFYVGDVSPAAKEVPAPVISGVDMSVASPKKEEPLFDWKKYWGFARDVKDRNGRKYTVEDFEPSVEPIPNDEVDFDVYCGKKQGSVRKAK